MNRFDGFLRWMRPVLVVCTIAFAVGGCSGDDGRDGADGVDGTDGTPGGDGAPGAGGPPGADGDDGADGANVAVASIHGTNFLLSTGEFEEAGKYFATATVTSATADVAGVATVNFTVEDCRDAPPCLPAPGITGMDFNIVALAPASGGESFNKWVPYIYRTETVAAPTESHHDWTTATGTVVEQAYRENNGTFTDNGDGSYTYVFATNLSTAVTPVGMAAIPYDRTLTHRVSVMIGGHSGATADANFDFVPDGSAVTETRNIVETSSCQNCHGANEFHGHGGDRLTNDNCVTCHAPDSFDAQSGESLDMKVMAHKIHAGGELSSIPGFDGLVWDDPATMADESEDNGEYAIWGYRTSKHEWWKAQFPAIIENCTACHNGMGAEVDNWKNVASRDACGSCHDDVDFASGTNHGGGVAADDSGCNVCHASGTPWAVADMHDWTMKDQRNIPEFAVDMSVSDPANGTHFVAGEAPVVTVVLNDNGALIDHTTVWLDTDGKEGCLDPTSCPMADGLFDHAYLFVNGPRAKRNPALTTAAYAKVVSSTAGTFDLSAAGGLELKVDNGRELLLSTNGGQRLSGMIDVAMDVGFFAAPAAATPAEIVDWLNADSGFAARTIAYLENGFVAIRSRNLGEFFAVQLLVGDITTAVFGGDNSVHIIGGYYPSAKLTRNADPANDDPKASWSADAITYTLDTVDDLAPGTYTASVEITDRGRINGTNYKTPSVAKVTFEVGQAGEELAIAGNCGMCHQGPDGKGYVLDFARHYKIFDNTAVDQCGGCHDYQSGHDYGAWYGGKPISRRVHAVHNGSALNFPNLTVDYNDPVKGRNWDITFPQYIKNCEACHADGTTSGSWATEAARLPCSGCHDSEAATAHLKLQTYDPTPLDPWNGDEEESCKTCH